MCSLFLKATILDIYFTSLQLVFSAVWRTQNVSPFFTIVQITFSLCNYLVYYGYFDNRIYVSRCKWAYAGLQTTQLYMKRLNKIESPIFILLCVHFFQKAKF